MSEMAERYRKVAQHFTDVAVDVADEDWERPAPCEGWVARDVVRHMVEWMPGMLETGTGIRLPEGPSVDVDPVGAWLVLSDGIQALLDDPVASQGPFSHPQAGDHRLDDALGMFFMGDILLHSWDLARATGGDERLDPDEVHGMLVGMEPIDEMLRQSGHYGPKVEVSADADEQTRLIAFVGRRP